MVRPLAIVLIACPLVCGCGASAGQPSSTPPPSGETADSDMPADSEARAPVDSAQAKEAVPAATPEAKPETVAIPTECADSGSKICTPSANFVDQMCRQASPDLAMTLFKKGSPWTRAYLRRNMEAWYTGARRSSPEQLIFDEEVLIVANRTGDGGGVQVSGSGNYDVVRWNGSCVSVMSDEVTLRRPPVPKTAAIPWRRLRNETKSALRENKGVKFSSDLYRRRCKGDRTAKKCTNATEQLSLVIANYVRGGGEVPEPHLLAWK